MSTPIAGKAGDDCAPGELTELFLEKLRFKILAAIKDTLDKDSIPRDDKCNCDAPLKPHGSQTGQQIVSLCSALRERLQPPAVGFYTLI